MAASQSALRFKQASRSLYECLHSFMVSLDFEEGKIDPCIFVQKRGDRTTVAFIYVDDILAFSSHIEGVNEFKHVMNNRFETNNFEDMKYFVGIEFGWTSNAQQVWLVFTPRAQVHGTP